MFRSMVWKEGTVLLALIMQREMNGSDASHAETVSAKWERIRYWASVGYVSKIIEAWKIGEACPWASLLAFYRHSSINDHRLGRPVPLITFTSHALQRDLMDVDTGH